MKLTIKQLRVIMIFQFYQGNHKVKVKDEIIWLNQNLVLYYLLKIKEEQAIVKVDQDQTKDLI